MRHAFIKRWVVGLLILPLFGFGCGGGGGTTLGSQPVKITIWGVFDSAANYAPVIAAYKELHPNVTVEFREYRSTEYEDELVRAIAENRGPDIFLIHQTWLKEYLTLIQPMPASVNISRQEVQGAIKKEVVTVAYTQTMPSLRAIGDDYVETVEGDVIIGSNVYGLPTSLDTLALFWNRDLLSAAGIAEPPDTWTEFQEAVIALTNIDEDGNIVQSGVGLGTSENVERAADILTLLMMQNGTVMTDAEGATFHETPPGGVKGDLPGLDAVRFYTDFANPTKEVYTWNEDQANSFDAFTKGTSAMFFGYAYHLPLIRTAAPKLNFEVSAMPQIDGGRQVNFASYWMMTVAKDTPDAAWAWDFARFLSFDDEQNTKYLNVAKRPPALRGLIATQLEHDDLAPFASQVLTAKTWYHGNNVVAAEDALEQLIDNVLTAALDPVDAIELAAEKVNQTL